MSEPRTTVLARRASLALPPLVWLLLGWRRRWIADDGLIAARTVRQILAGHGPVFNVGERVEANTSALWTWLLASLGWITRANVYTLMEWTGLVLAPLGLFLALAGSRLLHRHRASRLSDVKESQGALIPAGALIVLALPPFWDFVTSGLEESLVFCWLGLCWWLLAGLDAPTNVTATATASTTATARRGYLLAFVAGLGWVVRPDLALGTVCFLAGLWFILRPPLRRAALLAAVALAVPVGYELFRMGYYGLLVPNTALAKEAGSVNLGQGMTYLGNFVSPYLLWIPLLLLAVLAATALGWRSLTPQGRVAVITVTAAGLLMLAYVVAIGGDFMHARMLLPGTFALLLPVMAVPVPTRTRSTASVSAFAALAGVGVWAVVCALSFRLANPTVKLQGIVDERAFWVAVTRTANPTDATPYVAAVAGRPGHPGTLAWNLLKAEAAYHPQLVYQPPNSLAYQNAALARPGAPVAVPAFVLGTIGAAVPLDALVVDEHGLSYALGSHLAPQPGGRVGHDKYASSVWIVAQYTTVARPPGMDAADVAAARRALGCGSLLELQRVTQSALGWDRFWSNVGGSFQLTALRVPDDPYSAGTQTCGY